ncbi:MAG: thioredoxin domain-containing protein [Chloroflexi bacterium]|nr:thioredoxin domain-containing protein [Chloroflexota bacterium]
MTNRLAQETSPYLRQHADNPVDWYPWGAEALAAAQAQDKPILLSIGYAACHWCHVMAHESFEDEDTAVYMNAHFINIKVDREERPDLDSIYMNAVVALTGQGGWPMTVALMPDGRPFFGGTYFPSAPRYGMPSFRQVLEGLHNAWQTRRADIDQNAAQLTQHLTRDLVQAQSGGTPLDETVFSDALGSLLRVFDSDLGGFGRAPKFPPSMTLEFLLRMVSRRGDKMALHMVEHTLQKMAFGGIYDQIGGGFARYATDDKWLVPHFEKMLYDNALLARVYLHAYQITDSLLYRRVAEETLDFVLRDLRHESGGFYSSYDADSEGEEGKFYVWSAAEIRAVLGEEADLFMLAYDVTDRGNWEGKNILNLPRELAEVAEMVHTPLDQVQARLAAARQNLLAVRGQRVWPGLDDKVLTAWNGLMLAAFAEAGRVLHRPDYTAVATQNAEFLFANLRAKDGRLLRTWKAGSAAKYNGYLEDYAYLADGLLALYQTTFDARWFQWARQLGDLMLAHFQDEANGGFFDTSDDHEALIQRPKDLQDNAIPSGNAMAAQVLLRLSLYTGDGRYWDPANRAVTALYDALGRFPSGFSHWLCAADLIVGDPQEVAIVGDVQAADTRALLDVVQRIYRPNVIVAAGHDGEEVPLLAERPSLQGHATAYVCRQFVCRQPVTDPITLARQLNGGER